MPKKTPSSPRPKRTPVAVEQEMPNLIGKEPRQLQKPKYQSFRLQRRIPKAQPLLPSGYRLFVRAIRLLWRQWKLFGGIILVYVLFNLVFVQGVSLINSSNDLSSAKTDVSGVYNGSGNLYRTGAALFVDLLDGGVSTGSSASEGYQFVLILLISLALIWALRQTYAPQLVRLRIRDSFYRGMAPLIPFALVLLVIGTELIPGAIGIALFTTVRNDNIASLFLEKALWALAMFLLLLLSCYLITSTIFALYVVTLPEMTPMRALRSTRQLVRYRRWIVMRKVLFMPLSITVAIALVMTPFLLFFSRGAPAVFFILAAVALGLVHSYMYGLYRELLNEEIE
jgi:hypothetical protein